MKRLPTSAAWLPLLLCLVASPLVAHAQFGSFADVPIEISVGATGRTGYQHGVATADGEVSISYGEVSISCEHAEYNAETRDVLVSGSVRIYRQGRLFTADRAIYNLETKRVTAADFHTQAAPFRVAGDSVDTLGGNAYLVTNGILTTSDNSIPGYHIRAKSVRIHPKDKVILTDATLYLGRIPVLWLPYIYQSLNREQGFLITPGYHSTWGAHLLTRYSFPIGESVSGKLRLDLMSKRGLAAGLASAGIGAGTLVGPLCVAAAIEAWGWRGALQAMAVAVLVLGLVVTSRLRQSPLARAGAQGQAAGLTLAQAWRLMEGLGQGGEEGDGGRAGAP
jgi:lipopolysaccharide assembly outer membrane protein LptD (OstA)